MSDLCKDEDTVYFWFIAFEWNVHEPQPFQIFVREYFGDDDIPDNWFTGRLTEEHRAVKLRLNAVASQSVYSIFCKVEKGNYINIFFVFKYIKIRILSIKTRPNRGETRW